MMSTLQPQKQLDFYYRAKKQYENGVKPFTYQLNIFSTQPKPKKFMIIINKFIDILKDGMKQEYSSQEELKDNYWNQIQKYFIDTYQMTYIAENSYQKKKNKLRLYFGLLMHNKTIFQHIHTITQKLSFMYQSPQQKLKDLDKLFQPVNFFKDGQYTIMSDFVNQYQKYEEIQKQKKLLQQKRLEKIQKQRKIQQQIVQNQRRNKQRIARQLKIKEQKQLIQRKQREQREKLQLQNKKKLQLLKENNLNQGKKQNNHLTVIKQKSLVPQVVSRPSQMQFIPQNYNPTQQLAPTPHQPLVVMPIVYERKKKGHQKNSQILFEQRFKDQLDVFSFKLKPDFTSNPQRKQKCAECQVPLKQGFYFFGGNQNQCMYTGDWFCNQHIADQRISIPWKAIEEFDLKGYTVSKKSYIQIKSYYEKPLIQINNNDPNLKKSRVLYDFFVLKRQIHLIYDSICDLQLMEPLLKKRLNYCLKQNLFSLKNLYDIYNGHQGPSLMRQYDILSKHFYRCERCQKRKGYICSKCKDPVKIFAFQLNIAHGCSVCKKFFHRKCLMNGKCECQDD